MKKIILISLLLLSVSHSQGIFILLDDGGFKNAEVKAYNTVLTTPLSNARLVILDNFITKIKDSLSISALSTSFDRLWLVTETQEGMFNSIVNPTSTDMSVGATTVTYTIDQGFAGDDIAGYVNTNFNLSTSGVRFTQNSASIGVYIRNDLTDNGYVGGALAGSGVGVMVRSDNGSGLLATGIKINSSTAQPSGFANTDASGFYIVTRYASDSAQVYKNGILREKWANASAALLNLNLYLGCYNSVNGTALGFTAFQIGAAFIGKGFTAIEVRKINNCIEWYMDELGTGVQ